MKEKRIKIISPFAILSVVLFIIIGIVYFISDLSQPFADLINDSVSQTFRRAMASIGEFFSFSLFELLIACLPIILFVIIYRAIRVFSDPRARLRFIINFVAAILIIYSGHLLALGIAHNTTSLDKKMGLSETVVTEENLRETLRDLVDEVNSLSGIVSRDDNGIFTHNYTYPEASAIICDAYDRFAAQFDLPKGYFSSAKGVRAGAVMSYLGITGIYTYVTGEANVNTSYPDYVTLFTTAHEMSHQRGIIRENEANFVAYILLSSSNDPAMRYSAALNMYSYFASALYKTDKDAYSEIVATLSESAKTDIRAANAVSQKYGDTIIEDISEWINDFYLESSGSCGIVSYGRVVELVLAYRYSDE